MASPNRAIPALSPRAWRSAWPRAIATSSTVWCTSISVSPVARTVRSIRECLPSAVSMWSKNGTVVEISVRPVPSRSSSTRTSDSDVVRCTRPVRLMRSSCVCCSQDRSRLVGTFSRAAASVGESTPLACAQDVASTSASWKARISPGVPIDTRSHPSGPPSRINTPRSSNPCHTACRSANAPKSTKFASDSAAVHPCSRSQVTVRSRSARSPPTWAISSSVWARAARATAWVTADRWYGRRTTRSASTRAGAAARYPIRAPAIPNALDMVRLTARFGYSASSSSADGVPARRNSPYASSTTTTQPPGTSSALELLAEYPNLAVSRTMSKACGIAGARIGYLAAAPALVDALRVVRLPYHLSAVTQAVARAALAHADELMAQVGGLRAERDRTVAWLRTRGWTAAESDANFVLFGVFADRHAVWQGLLDRGVLIREVGPDGWLRVSIGTPGEMLAFQEALVAATS